MTTARALPSLLDIEEAQSRISSWVRPTPLVHSPVLSQASGAEVYLKLETAHPIHVFKMRGAFNRLLTLTEEEKARGVMTASSGNHGLAVAFASRQLGLRATIFVPENAPSAKLAAIRAQGAQVVQTGQGYDQAFAAARAEADRSGGTFVHAYDDPLVVAGQGTLGLELAEELPGLQHVFVPIGGGGLISGIALALHARAAGARVIGVQSEGADSAFRTWEAGSVQRREDLRTVADGLSVHQPGEIAVAVLTSLVEKVMRVSDDEILEAVAWLLREERVLSEPSGAAALAAALQPGAIHRGEKVAVVVSGGNLSWDTLKTVVLDHGRNT